MERTFEHSVTYTNTGRVPVADVAASLVANERLMREALEVIQDLFPGLEITDIEVSFRRASSESPLQEAIVAVTNIIYQGDIDTRIPKAITDLTGIVIPKSYDSMVTLITIGLTTYGIHWLLSKAGKKDQPSDLTVQGNFNQIVVVGRDLIGVDEDSLRGAIQRRYEKSRGPILARRVLEMIRPAQRENGAAITGGGVKIAPETVAAAPLGPVADDMDNNETQESYTDQIIVIHATDLDSHKTGWAGHLPGIWEKRVPMRLFPAIDPHLLFGKAEVTGDVIVVSKKNQDGDYIPYVFHVIGVD